MAVLRGGVVLVLRNLPTTCYALGAGSANGELCCIYGSASEKLYLFGSELHDAYPSIQISMPIRIVPGRKST